MKNIKKILVYGSGWNETYEVTAEPILNADGVLISVVKDKPPLGYLTEGGEIEVGDIVSLTFLHNKESFRKVEVLHIPREVGDCWKLKNIEDGGIHYVFFFERMTLLEKGVI